MKRDDYQYIEPVDHGLSPQGVAHKILQGFDRHYALFRYGAQRAKALFEAGDWRGIQQLARERIEYYDMRVRECAALLARELHEATPRDTPDQTTPQAKHLDPTQVGFWHAVKADYALRLAGHQQPECAETFFNSVSCRVLHRNYFNNDFLFVRAAIATEDVDHQVRSYRVYYPVAQALPAARTEPPRGVAAQTTLPPKGVFAPLGAAGRALARLLADFGLAAPYADLPRDVRALTRMAVHQLRLTIPKGHEQRIGMDCQIHVLNTLFYRNKGAYAVGRLINQGITYPFAIALLRNPAGQVCVDALLHGQDDLSALFSFTRAYFLVDMPVPSAYVAFLSTLLARKSRAELYTAIGLQKQGKTLFYRDFLHHLAHSHDVFDVAPGIAGMVMTVFTLPSYPYVFKLIRDHSRKDGMTRETVVRKYQFVKRHDRVGRMADSWEYSQVALPRARFSPTLLQELRSQVPSQIEETQDLIVLHHVYIERRMTPLNLHLARVNDAALEHAVQEYGQAIRELAAANIFPGDLLFKNFGVTRLGRVVFYDYDEIQTMAEMRFRRIPPAPNDEAELSGEVWYPVGVNDVFPEEFARFLLGDARVRAAFLRHHADLLDADWWQACRARVVAGHLDDLFPYASARRLHGAGDGRCVSPNVVD